MIDLIRMRTQLNAGRPSATDATAATISPRQWGGQSIVAMGAAGLTGREWVIKDAKGRKYSFDSKEEAFQELPDCGEGATVWTREVYRILFIPGPSRQGTLSAWLY
ncbi:hypothetical protein [Streptomyces sp. NPDC056683]|uniref:hypothetical protein n=1 Tax=Streptomyces sp. NPDC056683 TaxID=3345910 RepID=UPI0036C74080